MKRTPWILWVAFCPGRLEARQEDPIEVQVAVLAAAAAHAREVAHVPASEMVIAPRADLSSVLERLASRLGSRFGTVEELVRCESRSRCTSPDGTRAGFQVGTVEIGADSAVVGVDVWYLTQLPGSTRLLSGQADRLELVRSGADWRVVRVTREVTR